MFTHLRAVRAIAGAWLVGAAVPAAAAADLSWSGFATVGYAQSDQDFHYLRWIDDGGTFNTDTVGGVQADLSFSPRWSATVQLRAAPATDHDSRWELEPSWAFVAWRPADGWLLRAGKLRVPLYLYSEILDVGAAYDMARLPVEMYSVSATDEMVGGAASYEWALDAAGESLLSISLYGGRDRMELRNWVPDGIPGLVSPGLHETELDMHAAVLVVDLTLPATRLRAGLHRVHFEPEQPMPARFPHVQPGPGLGYDKVDPRLPGPAIDYTDSLRNEVYTLGVEHRFAAGWRVTAEYARIVQRDIDLGSDSHGGYVAVFKECGRWTPYLSYGRLQSTGAQLDIVRGLVDDPLPPGSLGGAEGLVNAAQAVAAAQSLAVSQQTAALGTSLVVPGGKLKLEWARTWVDDTSWMIDERPGDRLLKDRQLDVWTLSYSVAF